MLTLEGLTQKEIAEKIGKTQSAVSHRLKGTHYDLIVKVIDSFTSQIRDQVELAEKIKDTSGEAKMLLEKGKYYLSTFRYARALELIAQSLEKYSQAGDRQGEAGALCSLGDAYSPPGRLRCRAGVVHAKPPDLPGSGRSTCRSGSPPQHREGVCGDGPVRRGAGLLP